MKEINYSYFHKEFLVVELSKLKMMFNFSDILDVKISSIDHINKDVKYIKLILVIDNRNLSRYTPFLSEYISVDEIGIALSLNGSDIKEDLITIFSKCKQIVISDILNENSPILSVLKAALYKKMGKRIYKACRKEMYELNKDILLIGNMLLINSIDECVGFIYNRIKYHYKNDIYNAIDNSSDIILSDEYYKILETYYKEHDDEYDYQMTYNCRINIKKLYIVYNSKQTNYDSIDDLLNAAVFYNFIDKSLTVDGKNEL